MNTGNNHSIARYEPPTQLRLWRLITILFLLLLVAGIALLLLRDGRRDASLGNATDQGFSSVQAETKGFPIPQAEDLQLHSERAVSAMLESAGEAERAKLLIQRALPALKTYGMSVEIRRLQTAIAAAESARSHSEEARQEAEIIHNLLMERNTTHHETPDK